MYLGEPTDIQLYNFLLYECDGLRFSTPTKDQQSVIRKKNPKRLIREAKRIQEKSPAVSKAYDAIRLEMEKNKKEKKQKSGAEKEIQKQKMFELKQQQKKEKLKGH